MSLIDGIIGPIAGLLDKVIPDPRAREQAKLELLKLEGTRELDAVRARLEAILAEARSTDPWTSRARPAFLYVMYALLLWSIPMGLIAAAQPGLADAIGTGHDGLPQRHPGTDVGAVRHRLPRLHRRQDLGQGEGRGVGPIQAAHAAHRPSTSSTGRVGVKPPLPATPSTPATAASSSRCSARPHASQISHTQSCAQAGWVLAR